MVNAIFAYLFTPRVLWFAKTLCPRFALQYCIFVT